MIGKERRASDEEVPRDRVELSGEPSHLLAAQASPITWGHRLRFKRADIPAEFEQIHALNYRTFVEEIPQHTAGPGRRLVDRFHGENVYLLALDGPRVVGMLAVRGARPFSLDYKLSDLDRYLPCDCRPCEIRLLAVEPAYRGLQGGRILQGLFALLRRHCAERGYDIAVLSATTRQLRLYAHLGCRPFGPRVGTTEAAYQPMTLTARDFDRASTSFLRDRTASAAEPLSLLPGPVALAPEVQVALSDSPLSHRDGEFALRHRKVRDALCRATGACAAVLMAGSGTLANDAIAAQLAALGAPGLIVANGEFGERLVDHARRASLPARVLRFPWGQPFDLAAVDASLSQFPALCWLWCVHCETSTGVLNDLQGLQALCEAHSTDLCVDCISSIGTVELDLARVRFAAATSAKALGGLPGMAVVFRDTRPFHRSSTLPRYFDLAEYEECDSVPFTQSSHLLGALHAALAATDWPGRFVRMEDAMRHLRGRLRSAGFSLVSADNHAAPGVVSIALPPQIAANHVAAGMRHAGYLVAFESAYLRARNWLQIALMSDQAIAVVDKVVEALSSVCIREY